MSHLMKVETADRKGADPHDMVTTKIDEAITYQVDRHQPTSWWWRQGPTGDPLPLLAVCDRLPSLSVSSLLKRASWWKVVLTSSAGDRHEPTSDTRMTRGRHWEATARTSTMEMSRARPVAELEPTNGALPFKRITSTKEFAVKILERRPGVGGPSLEEEEGLKRSQSGSSSPETHAMGGGERGVGGGFRVDEGGRWRCR
jgi:hypothetical protein